MSFQIDHTMYNTVLINFDDDNCISLEQILLVNKSPINEEQSWSIIYQCCKSLLNELKNKSFKPLQPLQSTGDLFLNQDGNVHTKSWTCHAHTHSSVTLSGTCLTHDVFKSLGSIVFQALDYGLDDDEERKLSPSLEKLIKSLFLVIVEDDKSQVESDKDDGYGDEITLVSSSFLNHIISYCQSHSSHANSWYSNADFYYRHICRALVNETVELSRTLNRVKLGRQIGDLHQDQEEENFQKEVWGREWTCVMDELNSKGVRLKHIDTSCQQQNKFYELTPFEKLLDDIKCCRYKLKKIPQVEKKRPQDTHDVILECIKSRPLLRPASQRKLRPQSMIELSLHEKFLAEIKSEHHLRPTPPVRRRSLSMYSINESDFELISSASHKNLNNDNNNKLVFKSPNNNKNGVNLSNIFSFLNLSVNKLAFNNTSFKNSLPKLMEEKEKGRRKMSFFGIRIW